MYPKYGVTRDGNGDYWATDAFGNKKKVEPSDYLSSIRALNIGPGDSVPATGNPYSYLTLKGLGPSMTTDSFVNTTNFTYHK